MDATPLDRGQTKVFAIGENLPNEAADEDDRPRELENLDAIVPIPWFRGHYAPSFALQYLARRNSAK